MKQLKFDDLEHDVQYQTFYNASYIGTWTKTDVLDLLVPLDYDFEKLSFYKKRRCSK